MDLGILRALGFSKMCLWDLKPLAGCCLAPYPYSVVELDLWHPNISCSGGIFEVRGHFCRLGSFCCLFSGRHQPSVGLTTTDLISPFFFFNVVSRSTKRMKSLSANNLFNRTSLFSFFTSNISTGFLWCSYWHTQYKYSCRNHSC